MQSTPNHGHVDLSAEPYFSSHSHQQSLNSFTMELGTSFPNKLEPFLLMSKSAKGAAAAKLIQDATSAPGVYVFGELLDVPSIQEVRK